MHGLLSGWRRVSNILLITYIEKIKSNISLAWNHAGLRSYSANTFWPILARIINQLIAFFVTAYVIRYLSPENYGQLSYSVSVIGIFSFIASMGLDSILYRNLIQFPDKHAVYMGTAVRIKLVAAFIACIASLIFAFSIIPTKDVSFVLICILSLSYIASSWNLIAYEFHSHINQKIPSIIAIFIASLLSVGKLIIVFNNQGIIYFALLLLLEPILYSLAYIYIRERLYVSMKQWYFEWNIAKNLLSDSWPLMITSSFALVYSRIDQVMLKHLIDTASVGIYDSAIKVAEAWYTIPALIVSSFFPSIINARKQEFQRYKKRLIWLALFLAGTSTCVAIIITVFADFIINLLYGPAYIEGVSVLNIYIWSGIWVAVGYVGQFYLLAENKTKLLFFTSFAAMIVNIVLNFILIPIMGIEGAAWATFVSYTVVALPIFGLIWKKVI